MVTTGTETSSNNFLHDLLVLLPRCCCKGPLQSLEAAITAAAAATRQQQPKPIYTKAKEERFKRSVWKNQPRQSQTSLLSSTSNKYILEFQITNLEAVTPDFLIFLYLLNTTDCRAVSQVHMWHLVHPPAAESRQGPPGALKHSKQTCLCSENHGEVFLMLFISKLTVCEQNHKDQSLQWAQGHSLSCLINFKSWQASSTQTKLPKIKKKKNLK